MIDSVRDKLQDIGGPDGCRSSGTGALDGEAPDEAFSADSIDLFPLQVGGHHLFVKHPSRPELVVKTFFPKEIRFYEAAQGIPSLLRVIAAYHGTISLPAFGDCLVLEDLTFGMGDPCIMDLKIGKRLYDDDATPEKRARMIKKSAHSTSGTAGFRISGMRCRDPLDKGKVLLRHKQDMRGLKVADLLPTLEAFLSHLPPETAVALIEGFLARLEQIREAVRDSNGRFYCSSILLVYDHDHPASWECRMIDFVHCTLPPPTTTTTTTTTTTQQQRPTGDENYLQGVQSLIEYLEKLKTLFTHH